MVSVEFKSAVYDNRLLRTRIMLKDSLVIDPTFTQFNEMLDYASERLSGLYEPHDGEFLESDENKWDEEIMNHELGQLVNNFSQTRIDHLKKVVAKVLRSKISTRVCNVVEPRNFIKSTAGINTTRYRFVKNSDEREKARREASMEIRRQSKKLAQLIEKVEQRHAWKGDIDEVERIAEKILKSVRNYRENR